MRGRPSLYHCIPHNLILSLLTIFYLNFCMTPQFDRDLCSERYFFVTPFSRGNSITVPSMQNIDAICLDHVYSVCGRTSTLLTPRDSPTISGHAWGGMASDGVAFQPINLGHIQLGGYFSGFFLHWLNSMAVMFLHILDSFFEWSSCADILCFLISLAE